MKTSTTLGLNLPEATDVFDYQTYFTDNLNKIDAELSLNGTTTSRPTTGNYIGRRYFDTTLGKPIFIKQITPSIIWVDSTGTNV